MSAAFFWCSTAGDGDVALICPMQTAAVLSLVFLCLHLLDFAVKMLMFGVIVLLWFFAAFAPVDVMIRLLGKYCGMFVWRGVARTLANMLLT